MVGKIVEVYPRKIIRNEAVTEPYFEVIKPGVTYGRQSKLPQQAINSRSQLQDAIYQSPPSWLDDDDVDDAITDENWLDVAKVFSEFAQAIGVLGSVPFGLKGDHAFGTVVIMRDRSVGGEWEAGRWDLPGVSINLSIPCNTCTMCEQAHTFEQDHNTSLVVALPCGHIFQKLCLSLDLVYHRS
ncbi:hypothetical protein HID58_039738 [Brassica napus]|uniref:RING-type domain-containing protein n=1 Tax=Brassica napus TaxID=3708 RepID=A0ABQ8BUU8_BRANA|nr:hypothetical protein HID58_039738 [Brassica napus]